MALSARLILPVLFLLPLLTACQNRDASSASPSSTEPAVTFVTQPLQSEPAADADLVDDLRSPAEDTGAADKAIGASTAAAPEPEMTVVGLVTRPDFSPLSGATVEAFLGGRFPAVAAPADARLTSTTTDQRGSYSLKVAENTVGVQIRFTFAGYRSSTVSMGPRTPSGMEGHGGSPRAINAVLRPLAQIRGQAVDDGGAPVPHLPVTAVLLPSDGESTESMRSRSDLMETTNTADDGSFVFDHLGEGPILLQTNPRDLVATHVIVRAPDSAVRLVLETEGGALAGRVIRLPDATPVSSASVTLSYEIEGLPENLQVFHNRPRVLTDAEGNYRFETLAPGIYRLHAAREGLFPAPGSSAQKSLIRVDGKEETTASAVELYAGHTISGRVLERGTTRPLEGVAISLITFNGPRDAVTDREGKYSIAGVTGGGDSPRITMRARLKGYAKSRGDGGGWESLLLPRENYALTHDMELERELTVSGMVVDKEGRPIPSARVGIEDYPQGHGQRAASEATTDEEGVFTIRVGPETTVFLRGEAPGFGWAMSDSVQIRREPVTGVRIVLSRGAAAAGVVMGSEGVPVGGARVSARIQVSLSGSTNVRFPKTFGATSRADGTFAFVDLPADQLITFEAWSEGHASARSEQARLRAGEEKTGLVLELRRGMSLSGVVLDMERKPVMNASILLSPQTDTHAGQWGQSDREGRFRFENLMDNIYYSASVHSPEGRDTFPGLQAGQADVELVIGAGGILFIGTVLDYDTGYPVADYEVQVTDGGRLTKIRMESDPPGVFTTRLTSPKYPSSVKITAPGFMPYDSGPFEVPRGQAVVERVFKLGPGGSVTGRAVDAETKEPVAGVRVSLLKTNTAASVGSVPNDGETITTGADGIFALEKVGPGHRVIGFTPPEGTPYVPMNHEVSVFYNDVTDLGDVPFGSGGKIVGRLLRSPGDLPVSNANVRLTRNTDTSTMTDDKGAFEFSGLVNGLYRLDIPEYRADSWVGLEPLETKEVILRIGAGTLNGQVTRNGEAHLASVHLVLSGYGQGVHRNLATDPSGRFEVKDLSPGRWQVNVTSSRNAAWATIEYVDVPEEGGDFERTFVLPAGAISGTVVDASGEPVEGARVMARRIAEPGATLQPEMSDAYSRAGGIYNIGALAPGDYTVTAEKTGLGQTELRFGPVVDAQTGSVPPLRLSASQGGTLISTALNMTTGKPVPSAWLYLFRADGTLFEHGQQRDELGIITAGTVPSGNYLLQVSALGHSVSEQPVEIRTGETVRIDDVLYEAGAFRWAIKDAMGNAAAGIPCQLTPRDGESLERPREGVTDRNGMFVVRGLYPGLYTATATAPGLPPVTATVQIFARNPTDLVSQIVP